MYWDIDINWEAVTAIVELCVILLLLFEIKQNKNKIQKDNEIIVLQFYSRFVERYEEILLKLPSNIYSKDFNYNEIQDKESFLRAMRSYFDLCSQEYYLYKKGKLKEEIWKEWEEGIDSSIKLSAFKNAWIELPNSQSTYNDFRKFMEEKISRK